MAKQHVANSDKSFGEMPANLIVITENGRCILGHCQVIIGGSKTIGNFLHDWIQRRTDTPELDLTEYSFDHVNSVINFFYTHDLIVEHSCYTSDLDRLVQKFDCPVLTRRFRTIKMMYEKYKMFQYGEKHVYSRKGHQNRIRHRGNFNIGSEAGDNHSLLESKMGSKWGSNGDGGESADGIRSQMSAMSTNSSYHNPILNLPSSIAMGKAHGQPRNPFSN